MILKMELPSSVKYKLEDAGIFSLEELSLKTKKEVKTLKGIGPKALLEIEYAMFQNKISFKKEKRYSSDTALRKKLILNLIKDKGSIDWAREMRAADRLLKKYDFEFLKLIEVKANVRTLGYYLHPEVSANLDKKYSLWKSKDLVEEQTEISLTEKVGDDKTINKQKTLKDFLNV